MKKAIKHKNAKPSSFKVDEITLLFIVAILIMIISINKKTDQPANEAGKIMAMILEGSQIHLATDGIVDERELEKMQSIGYNQLKNYLNIKNDFCIYVEDDKGNIILAKGYQKLSRDGIHCRE